MEELDGLLDHLNKDPTEAAQPTKSDISHGGYVENG